MEDGIIETMPLSVELVFFFILGAIIGSFLNVVIFRMHTGRSLSGSSHCMSCAARLRPFDLIPIVSYLLRLGRCRMCGARFSPRYALVEFGTAILFVLVAVAQQETISRALFLILVSVLVVILVYDLRHLIIPDELVAGLFVTAVAISAWDPAMRTVIFPHPSVWLAGALGFLSFYALWKISGGRWVGLGDAKLAAPLSMLVGLSSLASLIILAFWIGAAVSVALLLYARATAWRGQSSLRFMRSRLTMKSEVPFAPFLILGFLSVMFLGASAFDITNEILSFML